MDSSVLVIVSDNEVSDEWVESYDSCDTDEEFDDIVPKKMAKTTDNLKNNEESSNDDGSEDVEANEDEDVDDDNKWKSNPAWADAIAKVLRNKKSVGKKAIVLSKAKKIKELKEKPTLDFEIVGAEEEKPEPNEIDGEKFISKKKPSMKEYQTKGRVKPTVLDKDREKTLMKLATRGVVQLFNTVRNQQKSVDKTLDKAGKSTLKREKLLENIDKKKVVKQLTSTVKSIPLKKKLKSEEGADNVDNMWNVLRDDFMMGTKLKDWDKKEETI